MKAWVGVGIACITIVVALMVNPAAVFGLETVGLKIAFAVGLLSMAGLAFVLGKETPETEFSHHLATWAAGFAVVSILAANMNVITGTAKVANSVAEAKMSITTAKARKKNREAEDVFVPDTLKINRVERVVAPESDSSSPFADQTPGLEVSSLNSEKNVKLSENWELSDEQKEQFRKFLKSQGLKYDPETAFKRPENATPSPTVPGDAP